MTSHARNCKARRRGITMIELLLASTITALTAMASATVLYAISSTATKTRDYRTQRSGGHYTLNRLGRTIREARSIIYVSEDDVALWMNDWNENDAVDKEELGRIVYDSSQRQIRFEYFDDSNAPAPVAAAPTAIFDDEVVMADTMRGTGAKSAVWADGVTNASFTGYPDSVETRVVMTQFTIDANGSELLFHLAASPRAPADYLFFEESKIAPDIRSTRVRRKMLSKWCGLNALTRIIPEFTAEVLK